MEVKRSDEIEEATTQVREYMSRVGAAAGLVVAGTRLRILRETYRGDPSIQVVGEFPLEQARGLLVSEDPIEFEERVQRWLEAVARLEDAAEEPLLSVLRDHVLPVILDGTVRAAGPRSRIAR